jgi:uncharacterized protein
MKILLTGATGMLGRELGKRLAARGDDLTCLVRDVRAARLPFPATCVAWDHTRPVPAHALQGVEAIVHLAGTPLADGRWTEERKRSIRDSRVLGTRAVVAAARDVPSLRCLVQASATGFHGDRGDVPLDADSAKGRGFLADVVADWEAETRPLAAARPDVRVAIVRTGVVLSRRGGALAKLLPIFRESAGGVIGRGRQWLSWVHVDDIVGLFLHALDGDADGVLEGVAPEAATNRAFTQAMCAALAVRQGPPVPAAILRAVYGDMAEVVLASTRVAPRRTLASGFHFRYARIDEALADLLAPLRGGMREIVAEQWVPHAPEHVWPYFCDEHNLQELTPPFLQFAVLGKSTPAIGEGTLIDYRLRLQGLPLRWQSRIEEWAPARRFVDTQVRGPYAHWRHAHEFAPVGGGTLMRDVVRYRLPGGRLGSAVAGWKVTSDVNRIFDYRATRIAERFGT